MFEGLTLGNQRRIESDRGWKDSYSALTYCTAEAVIFRKPTNGGSFLEHEILIAERTKGAPDCIGRWQGKWGGYIYPTDKSATHAMRRTLKSLFGWDYRKDLELAHIVGPELFRSTAHFDEPNELVLHITTEQAEQTPFEAKLFGVDATEHKLGQGGNCLGAVKDAKFIPLHKLVCEFGEDTTFLYWQMIAVVMWQVAHGNPPVDMLTREFSAGENYSFSL